MNLRELKYVILGDDKLSGKLQNITAASDKTTNSLHKHSTKLQSLRTHFKTFTNEVPGLGSAIGMLTNPIGLAVSGITALGYGLKKTVDIATEFNVAFRQLANINLDKSNSELGGLKQRLMDLSIREGFDPNKVATAYFDVQSLTGKYGKDVEQVINKAGKFSEVFQSDFNTTIAGAAKAMSNFGLSIKDLDAYFASSQKTVAVAKISYNELANVQSVYAGSAAAANQSIDSANKLLALFTIRTKSADEAATLTKSAFTSLAKPETIKAFKSIGINLYDSNNSLKQVGQIITELNGKFQTAFKTGGQRAVDDLRGKFQGEEGLINLLQVSADRSGKTLETLKQYSGAMTDFQKATKLANEDLSVQNDRAMNRFKGRMGEMGTAFTPVANSVMTIVNGILGLESSILTSPYLRMIFGDKRSAWKEIKSNFSYKTNLGFNQNPSGIASLKPRWEAAYSSAYANYLKEKDPGKKQIWANRMAGAKRELAAIPIAVSDTTTDLIKPYKPTGGDLTGGINGVAGGGSQVKNVTVNIQKLVEKLEVHAGSTKESASEIKRIVEETLIRAINGAEQVVGG